MDGPAPAALVVTREAELVAEIQKWDRSGGAVRRDGFGLEQFEEKCVAVFRPELRKNKELKRFGGSIKR